MTKHGTQGLTHQRVNTNHCICREKRNCPVLTDTTYTPIPGTISVSIRHELGKLENKHMSVRSVRYVRPGAIESGEGCLLITVEHNDSYLLQTFPTSSEPTQSSMAWRDWWFVCEHRSIDQTMLTKCVFVGDGYKTVTGANEDLLVDDGQEDGSKSRTTHGSRVIRWGSMK